MPSVVGWQATRLNPDYSLPWEHGTSRLVIVSRNGRLGWPAPAPAAAQNNPIQIENAKAGSTDWLLTTVARHDDEIYELGWQRRRGIEAYASHTSIKAGERLDVHVSTYPVNNYSVASTAWAITGAPVRG